MDVVVRVATVDDAEEVAALLAANRQYLAATDPVRDDDWFTASRQREVLRRALDDESSYPGVIEVDGRAAGRIGLHHIIRGPLQSATVGYWVGEQWHGRGVARTALAAMMHTAFTDLALHRLEAGTLVGNVASQKVLRANGFEEIGLARQFLLIDHTWEDHLLFQRIRD